jgi:hypothetical protein
MPRRRGAVVIAVNKTGDLPSLEGCVSGAIDITQWLTAEGFIVKIITDSGGPVKAEQIIEAINFFVTAGTYDQLVVYFSGHGLWKNDGELWLLTDAPGDANAAVSWVETAEFAKDCGIPNVVLISDACRSIPDNPRAAKVRGTIVFPNEAVQRSRAKVDKFMAAAVGASAYELSIGEAKQKVSVFTHCFLRAFRYPDADMIQEVSEDGYKIKVVPNHKLGRYLQREVAALLATANIALNQAPDAEVLSDYDAYIGRFKEPAAIDVSGDMAAVPDRQHPSARQSVRTPPTTPANLREVASLAVSRAINDQVQVAPERVRAINDLAQRSGFNTVLQKAETFSEDMILPETSTGFLIVGGTISGAIATNDERPRILSSGDGLSPGIIQIELKAAPACTVLLQFGNGCGTAIAALEGFIGYVQVDEDKVVNVTYVPSRNSRHRDAYTRQRKRIERLRAAVASAAQFGVFRLTDQNRARLFAEQIRFEKALDPTLGLYAAYAYSDADRREDVQSVLAYMEADLHCHLFDVAMLARTKLEGPSNSFLIVPFCPMLSQGWNLLRARGVSLPSILDEAQDELETALWTTFKPMRARAIFTAMKSGELK